MFGYRDKTSDAEHLAKGNFDARNRIVWRPDIIADAQARNAR